MHDDMQGCCLCGCAEEAITLCVGGYLRHLCTRCYRELDRLLYHAACLGDDWRQPQTSQRKEKHATYETFPS